MQIMCNHDNSLMIRFVSLKRDYSLSNFNLTGLLHDSFFCYYLIVSSMIHFFDSPFLLCHSKLSHDIDFQFYLPLCWYCLPIFYKSNLRMSIGCLQPLVKNRSKFGVISFSRCQEYNLSETDPIPKCWKQDNTVQCMTSGIYIKKPGPGCSKVG